MRTIFEKILAGELPSEKVFENEHVFAIKDIHPVAPVHILIITKKVIPSIQDIAPSDFFLLGEMVAAAQVIAKKLKIEKGYRLITNNGMLAGQTIHHLHFHLIGGRAFESMG